MSTQMTRTAKTNTTNKNIKMSKFYTQTQEEVYQQNRKQGSCSNKTAHEQRPHRHNHMLRGFGEGNLPVSYAVWLYLAASQSLGEKIDSLDENLQTWQESRCQSLWSCIF